MFTVSTHIGNSMDLPYLKFPIYNRVYGSYFVRIYLNLLLVLQDLKYLFSYVYVKRRYTGEIEEK